MKSIFLIVALMTSAASFAQTCDLYLSGGSFSPNPCRITSSLTIRVIVQNSGTDTCRNAEIRFSLSPDSLLDGTDCFLGGSTISIPPGGNSTAVLTVAPLSSVACTTYGRYFILAEYAGASRTEVFAGRLVVWPLTGSCINQGIGVLDNDQHHVDSYFSGSNYNLNDYTRRANNNLHGHSGNQPPSAYIRTRCDSLVVTDPDGWFDSTFQRPGIDAQVYAGVVYDYMWHVLGRNGPDNARATNNRTCMDQSVEQDDAYNGAHCHTGYPSSPGSPCFGSHDSLRRSMAGAIEIVGHEWGHGITNYESNLIYYGESGSMNDSWSDMLGIAIAFWSGIDPDWQDGEDVWAGGNPIRDLEDPSRIWDDRHEGGYFPDTYHGPGWYYGDEDLGGIHHNGTVAGHMFYLLSVGGQQNGVTVQGIGIDSAMKVLYLANCNYWLQNTDMANAREGCIAAAYTMDSSYAVSVMDAWAAVGIGSPGPPPHRVTNLTARPSINGVDVQLRWSRVATAQSYRIYAGDSWNFALDSAHFIAATPNTQYVHVNGLIPQMRFYQITASRDAP